MYREILEASEELGRAEQLNDIVYENTNQPIPIAISGAFDTHENLLAYVEQVNEMLALFQFRGILEGFVLEVDVDKLTEILTSE